MNSQLLVCAVQLHGGSCTVMNVCMYVCKCYPFMEVYHIIISIMIVAVPDV